MLKTQTTILNNLRFKSSQGVFGIFIASIIEVIERKPVRQTDCVKIRAKNNPHSCKNLNILQNACGCLGYGGCINVYVGNVGRLNYNRFNISNFLCTSTSNDSEYIYFLGMNISPYDMTYISFKSISFQTLFGKFANFFVDVEIQ